MEPEKNIVLDMSNRLFKISAVMVGILILACLAFMYYQFSNVPQSAPHEISVSGEGKAFGKPDIAHVSFGATTQELKSQDAVNKNNEIMNRVVSAIKALGVKDEDIQTTAYNLSPWYDYTQDGSIFKGYQLNQQVSVKIRDFDKISDVLDKATANGATNVGSLQFMIDDPQKVEAEARAMAIDNAKKKLKDITRQSGLRVGKLVNISEGYNNPPRPLYAEGMGGAGKDVMSVAPQIQTGQQEVTSTVTLTYQVR